MLMQRVQIQRDLSTVHVIMVTQEMVLLAQVWDFIINNLKLVYGLGGSFLRTPGLCVKLLEIKQLQRDPEFKKPLFQNESKLVSYIARPFLC